MADAVRKAYKNGEEDERLEPIVLCDKGASPLGRISKGDSVIFYDIRGEREIEITKGFVVKDFDFFPVEKDLDVNFATMIEYTKNLPVKVAFPPQERLKNTLSHVMSKKGFSQVKIVESEKAIHLGYFFNGKSKEPIPGEEKTVIQSFKELKSLDERPEMNIGEVTKAIISKLSDPNTDFILANLANVDVIGHIENEKAILKAVASVDNAVSEILEEAQKNNVLTFITADHGTVESWLYPDGTVDTGHTNNPVPFIVVEPNEELLQNIKLREGGDLTDVAPTILEVLKIEKPEVMTGKSLFIGEPYKGEFKRRILLPILDGWGANESDYGNLIKKAETTNMDLILGRYPSTKLVASGETLGMPKGTVGNSEIGHLHLGAGRRVLSDRARINQSIEDETFFKNEAFLEVIRRAKEMNKVLHLLGIVSFYSSHGSIDHLKALMKMAEKEGITNLYIHSILGRRGEKPESGAIYIQDIEKECEKLNLGRVVTVIGRHWVLDREENWDRIEKSYRTLVHGEGNRVIDGEYKRN
jgi:2,3-bisphosphoglycerate-independent phosphoglycerate mutase